MDRELIRKGMSLPMSRVIRRPTKGLRRSLPTAALAFGLLAACSDPTPGGAQPNEIERSRHHEFQLVSVAEGLANPWAMAFLPGGDMLVTERAGRLRVVRDGVLDPTPVSGVPPVWANGQGGLLDVALHPDFSSNGLIYLSYSKPNADGSEATTAVIRGVFDGARLTGVQEIFEAEAWSRQRQHFGSRLAFDRDGYLFITVGDRGVRPDPATLESHPAQDLTNHQGTTLRLHDDGRVPADNPFVGHPPALPEIWSYGHRNAQGLVVHPETNQVWLNEHGPQGGDEINLVLPGKNYGWPVVGFGVQYGGSVIHGSTSRPDMEDPVHYWVPSIATSGKLLYTGDAFPAWRGSMFVGGLAGEVLARVAIRNGVVEEEETLLKGEVGRIRDVRQGPDGFIYLAIDDPDGRPYSIVRLEPAGG
jgi:aldose sugar dehydrogenase